jgi:hypothetical protein
MIHHNGGAMDKRRQPTLNVSMPDEAVREFARQQAATFFANNLSAYVVSLIEGDREQGWTHQRVLKAIQSVTDDAAAEQAA